MGLLDFQENVLQWYTGYESVTCSFTQRRFITKFKKYAEEHPEEVKIVAENKDGSICAKFPLKWLKISPPRAVSEEQKAAASERLRIAREKKNENKKEV